MTTTASTSDAPPRQIIVSVDVEDWYHGPTAAARFGTRADVAQALASTPQPERGLPYLEAALELLAARNMRATFFWVAEYARRFPAALRRCATAGHEIACHGLTHFPKFDPATKQPNFTPAEFKTRTAEARKILQNLTGQPVIGYRAPNAYIAGWMLDALEELGFAYDSSVSANSLYNKTDEPQLTGVDTRPYFPERGTLRRGTAPRGIIEFPWPYFEFPTWGRAIALPTVAARDGARALPVLKIQTAGGPYLRFFGSGLVLAGLRQSLRRGPTVFYFHPVDMCREPIPLPFSWKRPMMWWFKGDLVRRRIVRVLDGLQGRTTAFDELLKVGAETLFGDPKANKWSPQRDAAPTGETK
ncbi:MAG: polysaccharide deacetylase [Verrucomicrobia bacterium]|nr:MAG: polysaccharide deacetylase [Verrucomicrobiota bacterium]